jgi:predicted RNA binding protein YcfA (HicA-like mRNA interferase family)
MSKFPSLTGKQLIAALNKAGFEVIRVKGSHHFLRHKDRRSTVVPVHAGETVGQVCSVRFCVTVISHVRSYRSYFSNFSFVKGHVGNL